MDATSCWVVYTNDVRFPNTQIHEVFTTEELAQEYADKINADDQSNGTPSTVRRTHVNHYFLRNEIPVL